MPEEAYDKATKVLDSLVDDAPAWGAMLAILHTRGLRDQLVRMRRHQRLRQQDVAERMGVRLSTVEKFETDRYPNPYISTLARYAHAIDCVLDIEAVPIPEEDPEDD